MKNKKQDSFVPYLVFFLMAFIVISSIPFIENNYPIIFRDKTSTSFYLLVLAMIIVGWKFLILIPFFAFSIMYDDRNIDQSFETCFILVVSFLLTYLILRILSALTGRNLFYSNSSHNSEPDYANKNEPSFDLSDCLPDFLCGGDWDDDGDGGDGGDD